MGQDQEADASDRGPGWRAGAVAARLGVAPSTLRTWSQRYDLGPTGHLAGRHRRYTAADLARLEHMRALVASGIAPAEAARSTRSGGHTPGTPSAVAAGARSAGSRPAGSRSPRRDVPPAAVANLLAATQRLEAAAVASALRRHLAERGVVDTWEQVCRPVLAEMGRRYRDHGDCIDAEHLLSWTISSAMHQVAEHGRVPGARAALLACVTAERHTLPLEALRAALAERGAPAHMFGADTPTSALVTALARIRPEALVLWAQSEQTAQRSQLDELGAADHAPGLLIAAGPGWEHDSLPPSVRPAGSLQAAVDLIHSNALVV